MADAITPDVAQLAFKNLSRVTAKRDANARRAHESGVRDKRKGFVRVSPFYEDFLMESCWMAGFDGTPIEEALACHGL